MRTRAALLMGSAELAHRFFPSPLRAELEAVVELAPGVITALTPDARRTLQTAELVIGGWGGPEISRSDAPMLRGVLFLGGRAASCLRDPQEWRGTDLQFSNLRAINARPVAEYTLAMILLAGKSVFAASQHYRRTGEIVAPQDVSAQVGNYRRTLGIVGLSQVARLLIELLRPFDYTISVFDPWVSDAEFAAYGVARADLQEIFRHSDIVSLHQALTPETAGQIDSSLLAAMRDGATLINTARGAVVDQDALTREVSSGRIHAILDVTDPEPLAPDGALWDAPTVFITPHCAGSMGTELLRMSEMAVSEAQRFTAGKHFTYSEALG